MVDALDPILSALARLLVARRVAFADLIERLKGHYVAAAAGLEDKPNDSRLSVRTGLARREIARLRAFEAKPSKPSPMTRIVALWRTDPLYAGRALPRNGPVPSFEALARTVLQDVHPRTLLDALLEAGTVRVAEDQVHLVAHAYLPRGGSPEQFAYLADNVGDHLRAASENTLDTPRHFERALHVEGLYPEQIATLAERHRSTEMALLESLQREAEQMKAANKIPGPMRLRVGGYVYSTERTTE